MQLLLGIVSDIIHKEKAVFSQHMTGDAITAILNAGNKTDVSNQ